MVYLHRSTGACKMTFIHDHLIGSHEVINTESHSETVSLLFALIRWQGMLRLHQTTAHIQAWDTMHVEPFVSCAASHKWCLCQSVSKMTDVVNGGDIVAGHTGPSRRCLSASGPAGGV